MNGRIAALVESIKREAVLAAWPVGSIYTSTEAASPATIFGGTWERIKDRFLLAAGDTYTPGYEAGQAAVTLTIDNLPAHTHSMPGYVWFWGVTSGCEYPVHIPGAEVSVGYTTGNEIGTDQGNNNWTQVTGGGQAHDNMPPYVAVYMWKRTA